MKRFLAMLATGALALGLTTTAMAQTRGFGAGALILDDHQTPPHMVTVESPQIGTSEYAAWQAAGFPLLTWSVPVPPSLAGGTPAQSGFLFAGPQTYNDYQNNPATGPGRYSVTTLTPYQLPVWVSPGYQGFNNYGGSAGAWDYATTTQLGLVSGSGTPNVMTKWGPGGTTLVNSSITDDGTTITTTEPVSITGNSGTLTTASDITDGGGLSVAGTSTLTGLVGIGQAPGTDALDVTGNASVDGNIATTGGGTITDNSLTSGSVVFSGTSGLLSQNNTNFFWDNTNKSLNIGQNTNSFGALDVLQSGGHDVAIGGGANTGAEIKFLGTQYMSIYNPGSSLVFANTSTAAQTNTAGTAEMTLTSGGNLSTAGSITSGTTMTAGTGLTVTSGGANITGLTTTNSGISNTGAFTTSGGAASINASTAFGTSIGNGINALTETGDVAINTVSTDAGTTAIGNTAAGGNVTIGVVSGTSNLILNGIAGATDLNFLTDDASGNVHTRTMSGLADNGVYWNSTSNTFQLGGLLNTDVPFSANRYVNLAASTLNFTSSGGTLTPVQIVGGATPALNVVAPTSITGSATVIADNTGVTPNQIAIEGATSNLQQLLLGYNTTGNWGSVEAIFQGFGSRPLYLDPYTATGTPQVGVAYNGGVTLPYTLSVNGTMGSTGNATVGGGLAVSGVANYVAGQTTSMSVTGVGTDWIGGATFGAKTNTDNNVVIGESTSGLAEIGANSGDMVSWRDLYINAGGGNVRVGSTTAPTNTLDVTGTFGASGLSTLTGINNTGTFTTAGGAASINATTANTTAIGNGTNALTIEGNVAINNGATDAGSTTIGNTTAGNNSATTINVSGTGNLTLTGIAQDLTTSDFLTLDGSNNVRYNTLSNLIQGNNGVLVTTSGGVATAQLGGTSTGAVPFTASRDVNLDGSNLNFTSNGGFLTPVQIVGGASPSLNVVAITNINPSGSNGTAIGNSAAGAGGVNIESAGSVRINTDATAGNTLIGNATGTLALLGGPTSVWGVTSAGVATFASATTTGAANVGTNLDVSGTSTLDGLVTSGAGIANTGTFTTAGGAASINDNSSFATSINTGTSTGAVTIGNATAGSSVAITSAPTGSTGWSVTGAGAISSTGNATIATGVSTTNTFGNGGGNTTNTIGDNLTAGTTKNIIGQAGGIAGQNVINYIGVGGGGGTQTNDIGTYSPSFVTNNIDGATHINNSGSSTTDIGDVAGFGNVTIGNNGTGTGQVNLNSGATGSVNVVGPTNINTSGTNDVTIGNATGGNITLAVDEAGGTPTYLSFTGLTADASPTQMLTIDASHDVHYTTLTGTADQGVSYDATNLKYELGGTTNTAVPFTASRFVNLNASNLTFTTASGANTPLVITGGATDNSVALNSYGAGTIGLTGTTNINTSGTANTTIGNATGTLALLGGPSSVWGVTSAGVATFASATTTGAANVGTNLDVSGTSTLDGLVTSGAGIANTGTITSTGDISTSAGNITASGTVNANTTGSNFTGSGAGATLTVASTNATPLALAVTGNETVSGTLGVTGATTTHGIANTGTITSTSDISTSAGNITSSGTVTAGTGLTVTNGPGSITDNTASGTALTVNETGATSVGINAAGTTTDITGANWNVAHTGAATFDNGATVGINGGTPILGTVAFMDGTADAFTGTLEPTTLTASRTWTLPDVSGTVLTTGNGVAYNVTAAQNTATPVTNSLFDVAYASGAGNAAGATITSTTTGGTATGLTVSATGTSGQVTGISASATGGTTNYAIQTTGNSSVDLGRGGATNDFGANAVSDFGFNSTAASVTNTFGDNNNATAGNTTSNDFGSTQTGSVATITNTIGSAVTGSTVNTTIGGGAGTNTLAVTGATNINTTGAATTDIGTTTGTGAVNIGNTTGGTAVTGALSSTGSTTLATGGSTINSFGTGASAANTIGVSGGSTAINGSLTTVGAANINYTGSTSATNIGNTSAGMNLVGSAVNVTGNTTLASGSNLTLVSGNATISSGDLALNSGKITSSGNIQTTGGSLFANGGDVYTGNNSTQGAVVFGDGGSSNQGILEVYHSLTATRTYTLPDMSGTIALLGGPGSFTTLTSSGASTIGTGAGLANTFGAGGTNASPTTNTIGNSIGGSTTNDIYGATNINTTGAATTDIGTGGTGVVNIGNATGGTAITGTLSGTFAGVSTISGNGATTDFTIADANVTASSTIIVTTQKGSAGLDYYTPFIASTVPGTSFTVHLSAAPLNAETVKIHYIVIN